MEEKEIVDNLHEIYKDEEVITVRMRVKDYAVLMKVIERERSMGIVAKYVFTILGGILTVIALVKTGIFSKVGI